ncbi:MAG: spore coat associated protein CotJA [Clostridia bacterium]|nr:spore coat associated protein CotJA [Clostridia bacterium]
MYDENLILHLMGEQMPRPDAGVPCPHGARHLAMVYSPAQEWRDLYDNEMGHGRGTIFKELEFPFLGGVPRD